MPRKMSKKTPKKESSPSTLLKPPSGGLSKTFTLANPMPGYNVRWTDNKVYTFQQEVQVPSWLSPSAAVFQNSNASWSLAQIAEYASFQIVFDQYKIDFVEVWIVPEQTDSQPSGSAVSQNGRLYSVVDYDDSTNLAVPADYQSYTNCITTPGIIGHYRKFVPHIAVSAYGSGAFTSYQNESPKWCDCGSPNVTHFGIKAGASTVSTVGLQTYDLITRITISFRNVR